jgi:hypothetical protein
MADADSRFLQDFQSGLVNPGHLFLVYCTVKI